ncbi:uncharacterized protein EDB93DRAFT_1101322 [Suillus bovinus]|uniref:uncharacterized protein n=1 Tax=Suillus bovinus TaxID=48563 RepID=UPI001B85F4AE|nr:uncharacterized protein EDB93DRAFT_1101322 [Suillus bovinus]KAG2156911.1 hypothetical protein EDB93DRAFT_1101322 [Suillus bovinus]
MGFTLLPSLAILCSVAFATPYSAGSGNLIPDGVNTAGSTLLSAGAMLVIGDLSYTVAAALQGVGIPAEADSQCLSDLGLGNLNSLLKRYDALIKVIVADMEFTVRHQMSRTIFSHMRRGILSLMILTTSSYGIRAPARPATPAALIPLRLRSVQPNIVSAISSLGTDDAKVPGTKNLNQDIEEFVQRRGVSTQDPNAKSVQRLSFKVAVFWSTTTSRMVFANLQS